MNEMEDNRLFCVYKPPFISSNRYLSEIKRRYGVKKAGFSGTLDPFAQGVLVVAFGQYTKLFRFLKKSPKVYKATLFLGLKSPSLDIEKKCGIQETAPLSTKAIMKLFESLKGEIEYPPPNYSAKKIAGQRAYALARKDVDFELEPIVSTIYDLKLLYYTHPFITFEISISEGGYVRSIADIIAKRLGTFGALSYLERVSEGEFRYDDEKALNPLKYLDLEENFYLGDKNDLILGKKISINQIKCKKNGKYFINLGTILSIISIKDDKVNYILNGVKLC